MTKWNQGEKRTLKGVGENRTGVKLSLRGGNGRIK
jgi:hypothetical protein